MRVINNIGQKMYLQCNTKSLLTYQLWQLKQIVQSGDKQSHIIHGKIIILYVS